MFLVGLVLIFCGRELTKKTVRDIVLHSLGLWAFYIVGASIFYRLFGPANLDTIMTAVAAAVYAIVQKRYEPMIRAIRVTTYYACHYQILAISEPIGRGIEAFAGEDRQYVQNTTWITFVLLLLLCIFFIQMFTIEDMRFVPVTPAVFLIAEAVLGIVLQIVAREIQVSGWYMLLVAVAFHIFQLFSYGMFYMVAKRSKESIEAMSVAHKEQMDREMVEYFRRNMENMHKLRHELKHHMTYIRVLVANEEYDKLFRYTNEVLGENEDKIEFSATGNFLLDAIIDHSAGKAQKSDVDLRTQIIVPPELPYRDTDVCSLLSNLLDNAIEGAAGSGKEEKFVDLNISPRQDYLFVRVINPVTDKLSRNRILSLQTTKDNEGYHGFGTKVVRDIVAKYNGTVKFQVKDGNFVADVMLDLNAAAQNDED